MPIIKSRRQRKRRRRVLYLQLGAQLLLLCSALFLLASIGLFGCAVIATELRAMQLEEDLAEWLGLPINVDDAEVRLATEIALAKHSATSRSEDSSQGSEEPLE